MSRRTGRPPVTPAACRGKKSMARSKGSTNPPGKEGKGEAVNCVTCAKEIEKDEAIKHDNDYYCVECFNNLFAYCDACGNVVDRDTMTWIESDERELCSTCLAEEYTRCVSCKRYVKRDDAEWVGDDAYCDRCAGDKLFYCEGCDEYHLLDDSTDVGGNLYCETCSEDIAECELCGNRFFIEGMEEFEGNKYICARCAKKRRAVRCPVCLSFFQKGEIDQASGKCLSCLEAELEASAESKVETADVLKAFPGLADGIDAVFARSASYRSIDAREYAKYLEEMFPKTIAVFDPKNATYDAGFGEKGISELKSPRNALRKLIGDGKVSFRGKDACETFSALDYYVDKITNTFNDLKLLDDEREETIGRTVSALKIRFYKESKRPMVKERTDALEGTDSAVFNGNRYTFVITKDPVAILAKTTSQCWESMSCEKLIRGQYGKGAFSDIANSNLACFVLNDKKLPVARIMIRWCYTENGEIDFGIEKKWYFCLVEPEKAKQFSGMGTSTTVFGSDEFIGGLAAISATRFLQWIVEKRGRSKPFGTCSTPYVYDGYSDTAGAGHTRVRYPKYGE